MVRPQAERCPRGHFYNAGNTYIDPRGCKRCKACRRVGMRKIRKSKVSPSIQSKTGSMTDDHATSTSTNRPD
jgi:hypothetical protein